MEKRKYNKLFDITKNISSHSSDSTTQYNESGKTCSKAQITPFKNGI
jgi:hypothetical protein